MRGALAAARSRTTGGLVVLAVTHAVADSYVYVLPAFLPVLMPERGITLGLAGVLLACQQFAGSFLQPVLGHAADRSGGGRWMSWAGVVLSGLAIAAVGVAPGFAGLVVVMLANGVGTALYHPVSAALVLRAAPTAARGFWMSLYIGAGNFGLAAGPAAVALVVASGSLESTWLLAVPALLSGLLVWRAAPPQPERSRRASEPIATLLRRHGHMLMSLIAVIAVRSWAHMAVVTFLPVYAVSRGATPGEAALLLSGYLAAGGVGGLVGGPLADRLGPDRVVVGTLAGSVPVGVLFVLQPAFGPLFWVLAVGYGLVLNASWVPLTIRGQESVPGSVAMMSGMMIGLSIGLGGLAVTPMGVVAEHVGLNSVLFATVLLGLAGAALMLRVPKPPAPQPARP